MDRPSRFPLYLGIVLIAAGWVVLFVGWYQAGRQDLETGQIPYLLSGGFGAWGILLMGAAAVAIDLLRQAEWRSQQRMDELRDAIEQLGRSFSRPARSVPAAATTDAEGPKRPRRRRRRRGGAGRPREGQSDSAT